MSDIVTFSIQSGSNGNCVYIEAGRTRLLIDAGVSGKTVRTRMAEHGRVPDDIDALFITHEHSDHVRCAGIYQRMFGAPLYITESAYRAASRGLGSLTDVRHFVPGDSISVGDVVVHSFRTPHDAADGSVFVVEYEGKRLGVFTDLGHVFEGLTELVASVDAMYLESNYDLDMLRDGPYPWAIKNRIAGKNGHISNVESARLVREAGGSRHRWVALSHLSQENNHPELALSTHREIVGGDVVYELSSRYEVSALRVV